MITKYFINFLKTLFHRNTTKGEALSAKNFAAFIVKVVLDASARIIFFGVFMFTYSGQFNTKMVLIYYYGTVCMNILVNSIFSCQDESEESSLRNLIGKKQFLNIFVVPFFRNLFEQPFKCIKFQ